MHVPSDIQAFFNSERIDRYLDKHKFIGYTYSVRSWERVCYKNAIIYSSIGVNSPARPKRTESKFWNGSSWRFLFIHICSRNTLKNYPNGEGR